VSTNRWRFRDVWGLARVEVMVTKEADLPSPMTRITMTSPEGEEVSGLFDHDAIRSLLLALSKAEKETRP
jgi:NADPH-dependent ferric siderophore reductase